MSTAPDLTTATTEELAALAAQANATAHRAQAEAERRATERAARLTAAQQDYDRAAVTHRAALEQRMVDEAAQHGRAFTTALAAGDFAGVVNAWVAERATRNTRRLVRDAALNGVNRLGLTDTRVPPFLSFGDPDFLDRLQREAEALAAQRGADRVTDLLGDFPTEVA